MKIADWRQALLPPVKVLLALSRFLFWSVGCKFSLVVFGVVDVMDLMGHKLAGRKSLLATSIFLSLVVLSAYPFTYGYRLTADETLFHYYVMGGPKEMVWVAEYAAHLQGRIGNYLSIPLHLMGAYLSGYFLFRVFTVALYFTNFALFSRYFSLISGVEQTKLMFLVLLSLHPLAYFHLPPNAYPLHLSVPFFLILLSRYRLYKSGLNDAGGLLVGVGIRLLCLLAMLINEYAFVFCVSLILFEVVADLLQARKLDTPLTVAIFQVFRRRYFHMDAALVLVFMFVYLGYRYFYPSGYEGNKIADLSQAGIFIKTLFGHIYGGTSIAHYFSYRLHFHHLTKGVSPGQIFAAVFIFAGTFWVGFAEISKIRFGRLYMYWGAAGVASAVLVTIPVALTAQAQSWCGDTCAYVDSRVSYFGLAIFLGALVSVVKSIQAGGYWEKHASAVLAFVLAGLTTFTYLYNLRVAQDMKSAVSAWDRAKAISCLGLDYDGLPLSLGAVIDPEGKLSFHPGFSADAYWRRYIESIQGGVACDEVDDSAFVSIRKSISPIRSGDEIHFNADGSRFLSGGWSGIERWGVWSEALVASVVLPLPADLGKNVVLNIKGRAFLAGPHTSQLVRVYVNDELVSSVQFDLGEGDKTTETDVPYEIINKDRKRMRIDFKQQTLVSPAELGVSADSRRLGFGLISIGVN